MRARAAAFTLAAGLAVIVAAQLGAPFGSPPLYDGVVVQEPYRYLAPGPGQAGSPRAFGSLPPVTGSLSPAVVAATTDSPPQAQLVALPGAIALTPGASSLLVSIQPVTAPPPPPGKTIAGNVYRFAITDQSGTVLGISPGALPTLILRAPDGVSTAAIWRHAGATWQELTTEPAGQPGMFITNITELGDFALIGAPDAGPGGVDPRLILLGAIPVLLTVVALGVVLLWRRRRLRAAPRPSRPSSPGPSTRRRGSRRRSSTR